VRRWRSGDRLRRRGDGGGGRRDCRHGRRQVNEGGVAPVIDNLLAQHGAELLHVLQRRRQDGRGGCRRWTGLDLIIVTITIIIVAAVAADARVIEFITDILKLLYWRKDIVKAIIIFAIITSIIIVVKTIDRRHC
jgi:hypothetical protein